MTLFWERGTGASWEDGEFSFCLAWRVEGKERVPIIAVVASSDRPAASTLERLVHEYQLKEELDGTWALQPLELVSHEGRTVLLLTRAQCVPLEALLDGSPMPLDQFLPLAVNIAGALSALHGRGLVHKDLRPSHIVIDGAAGSVRFTGFGIASRARKEHLELKPPELTTGDLAYIAPEQTGRIDRSVDSRSDLYSLGVTFYRMLTGVLPFTAADPMEWVHCHIARRPEPPSWRVGGLPEAVSLIIMKLLAKAAEDRYQTASGLAADLERCLTEWRDGAQIRPFRLGASDAPTALRIPQKLYGRAKEVDALLAAFDHVASCSERQLALVSGYAGVGKTSVVHELHKTIVARGGLFASGKFDQYHRDIPYATLARAFAGLLRQILTQSEETVEAWRRSILDAITPNGALLSDLIPEIELIIGEQPPCPPLGAADSEHRFQTVWRRLLGAFARPEHPLVLFLDDLQWLDQPTLKLFMHLAAHPELRDVMLIGAYRDNEVGVTHPLKMALDELRRALAPILEIVLKPLSGDDVSRLVADALNCDERAVPLARLLFHKTSGNPFFVIQFMTSLSEEGLLTFDAREGAWTWDLGRIQAKDYTANVVDFMLERLRRLPNRTQDALKSFACLGNSADLAELAVADGAERQAMHANLQHAVREGLVYCQAGTYQFLHDRIQEAAYALIPEALRPVTHARIGRRFLCRLPESALHERVFEIVSQLNRGAQLITAEHERRRIAELNLVAGKRAKAATAYAAALNYLSVGRAMLTEDSWGREYDLMFELELNRAECEFLTGHLKEAGDRLGHLARHARSLPDLASVTALRVELLTASARDRAIEAALDYLRHVGVQWSAHPTWDEVRNEYDEMRRRLGERPIAALLELPRMADPVACGTMDVLTAAVPAAAFSDQNLFCAISCRMANLSLEHGNSDASAHAYTLLGMILVARFGDHAAGFGFGRLGLDVVEQPGLDRFKGRVYVEFGALILPWTQPIRTGRAVLRSAFDAANQVGDLAYAAYSWFNIVTNLLAAGDPLAEVLQQAETGREFAQRVQFGLVADFITGQLQLIRTLRGLTPTFGRFDEGRFSEEGFERHLREDKSLAIAACSYWIRKLQARVYANDYSAAVTAAARAKELLWTSLSSFEQAEYEFYAALAHARCCTSASSYAGCAATLAGHQRQLQDWAAHCSENFADRAALVGAEIARLEGRTADAEHLYEEAIEFARRSGFRHTEALAHEFAAAFYQRRRLKTSAEAHLRLAHGCYARWGADAKVHHLEQLHPGLATADSGSAVVAPSAPHLDVATFIKASQAISGQIELAKLVETLMTIAIQSGGADRGLLILPREGSHWIEAEARAKGRAVEVAQVGDAVSDTALPLSILRYVVRSREHVLLDDAASGAHPYSNDFYFQAEAPRSMLCLPLIKQGRLTGVLYLENSLTPHAFTPDRFELLQLLAAQIVISLENARLYADLQAREAKIRRLVDSNIIGIFLWERRGKVTAANDAALEIVGYTRRELDAGEISWSELTPPEYEATDQQALAVLAATGTCGPYEKEFIRKDAGRVPVVLGAALLEGSRDEGVAFVLDVTERKRAELRQKILVDELNHRVKNTLATVQSICAQTLRTADSPATFQEEFDGRLWALSQTHNVLNQSGWQDASLRQIFSSIFAPHFAGPDPRFEISGEDVSLGPTSAVSLGMAFHELATNAAKYGALSTPAGRVRIAWEVRPENRLHLEWQEIGGPEVQAPRRRGFGSRLIERNLPAQIRGQVRLEFLPEGVRFEMDASLDELCKV